MPTPHGSPSDPLLTVVLADDHAIVREGIAAICTNHGLSVVGQCSDGSSAVEMIATLKPDFALLDIQMPGLTGIEVIRKLRLSGSTVKLIIFSISRDENTVMEALRAGADGYLLKDGPSRHLLDAITFIRGGGIYVSPLLRGAGMFTKPGQHQVEDSMTSLSSREMEVFRYLVHGLRAKEIAEMLEISSRTVDIYRASLMRKLHVHDLVGLIRFFGEQDADGLAGVRSPRAPVLPFRPFGAAAEPPKDASSD